MMYAKIIVGIRNYWLLLVTPGVMPVAYNVLLLLALNTNYQVFFEPL